LYEADKDYNWSFFESTKKVQISGINVGIACFNSSWLCRDDNDFGMIAIGGSQIEKALSELEKTTFKIALMHHPIDFMRQIDQEHIKPLLHNNFDLILTGHTHKIESGHHQTLEGNVLISVSESIISSGNIEDGYTTGYSIVKVFPGEKYEISFRKYLPKHGKFVPNTDIGQDDGKKIFLIPSQAEQILDTKIRQIIKNIKSSHLEEM
jgi:hypothetical protein